MLYQVMILNKNGKRNFCEHISILYKYILYFEASFYAGEQGR
jgi:hypothetical protein